MKKHIKKMKHLERSFDNGFLKRKINLHICKFGQLFGIQIRIFNKKVKHFSLTENPKITFRVSLLSNSPNWPYPVYNRLISLQRTDTGQYVNGNHFEQIVVVGGALCKRFKTKVIRYRFLSPEAYKINK